MAKPKAVPFESRQRAFVNSQRKRVKGLALDITHLQAEVAVRREQIKALRAERVLEQRELNYGISLLADEPTEA